MNSRLKYVVVTLSTFVVIVLLLGARQAAGVSSSSSTDDQYRHLAVYTEVLSRIKSDYVEEPDLKNVTLGAMNGLLESIDPYASYLNADQYKQYLKSRTAKKAGVGLVLSKRLGYVGVVDAIPGSPADKAGMNTGDILESINNVSTRDMPLVYAQMLLEGDPGTTIELGLLKFSNPEPTKLTLTRVVVHEPPVTSKMLQDQIGLIQAPAVDASRLREIRSKVEDLKKQGAKRFILDLRDNSTTEPEQGVQLANLFLDKGLISYAEGQRYPRQNFNADANDIAGKLPLVVITNRGTAGGAEIAAAALQDDKRAEIVGERTFGDAGIRKPITMDDGSAVILSIAKYYSPSGKAIQDNGVTPGVSVVEEQPQVETDDEGNPTPGETTPKPKSEDVILKKAIDIAVNGVSASASKNGQNSERDLSPGMTPLHIPAPPQK